MDAPALDILRVGNRVYFWAASFTRRKCKRRVNTCCERRVFPRPRFSSGVPSVMNVQLPVTGVACCHLLFAFAPNGAPWQSFSVGVRSAGSASPPCGCAPGHVGSAGWGGLRKGPAARRRRGCGGSSRGGVAGWGLCALPVRPGGFLGGSCWGAHRPPPRRRGPTLCPVWQRASLRFSETGRVTEDACPCPLSTWRSLSAQLLPWDLVRALLSSGPVRSQGARRLDQPQMWCRWVGFVCPAPCPC